ncbi:MAG: M16 family metallopeptidase [Myxococcota bacterium]
MVRVALRFAAVGVFVSCAATLPPLPKPVPVPYRPLNRPPPMTTVLLPVKNKPIVSFRLVFHAGSVDDPKGKEGLTALTAQLMAEGGTKKLSSAQLLDALYPMAAELDASTDKEVTVFVGRVHSDRLQRFFDIFSDVLLEPRFDLKELERLRTDAINTVKNRLRAEDDEELGKIALDALLYPDHPYRHFPGGTVQGLQAITLEDVKAHAARVFTQDRLVIGLAGAVDSALEAKVKKRLAKLPATGAPRVELPPAPGVQGHTLILKKNTLSTAVSMGYTYPLRRGDPDFYAVAFALSYLGEHRQFHGVLFQELREKRGLNYGDYAYAEHFHQEGWGTQPSFNVARAEQDFSIWLRPVEPPNAIFATRGALHYLTELTKNPPPLEQMETARGFLIGYTRLWEQTDQRRLGLAIDELFYGTPGFLEGYRQALATMTPHALQQAAARHLTPSKLNFVYVTQDAEDLEARLASKKPSPIRYPTSKPAEVTKKDKTLEREPLPMHPQLIRIQDAQVFMEN